MSTFLLMSDSFVTHGLQSTRFLCPWDFPGKNTGVGCYFLLDLPDSGTEPMSLASPTLAGGFFTTVPPGYQIFTCVSLYYLPHIFTDIKRKVLIGSAKKSVKYSYRGYFISIIQMIMKVQMSKVKTPVVTGQQVRFSNYKSGALSIT